MNDIKITPSTSSIINRFTSKLQSNKKSNNRNNKVIILGEWLNKEVNIPDGYDVICVNKAINHVRKCDYFITMNYNFVKDPSYYKKIVSNADTKIFVLNNHTQNIRKKSDGYYYDTRYNYKYEKIRSFDQVIESRIQIDSVNGFSTDNTRFVSGGNSNFSALQFAILKKYKEVHLVGYDFINKTNNDVNKKIKYRTLFLSSIKLLSDKVRKTIFVPDNKSFLINQLKQKDTTFFKEVKQPMKQAARKNYNKDIVVVGYYTVGTPYEKEKDKLVDSINKFGYDSYIKGVENLGDWNLNTKYKAVFLMECLIKFPNKKIVYVDVDAVILKPLDLFTDYKADTAVRVEDWRWRKNEYLSGTMYLESNPNTIKLVEDWINRNNQTMQDEKKLEQWNLGEIIEDYKRKKKINFKILPPEYTYIFDLTRKKYPGIEPVIIHNQASRKNKRRVTTRRAPVNKNINFTITDELFINNEDYSNSLKTQLEKKYFYTALQKEAKKRLNTEKAKHPNKKVINLVMFDHWGWVFSYITEKYKKYASEYIVLPSVYPLDDADVYQYFRPVHRNAQEFFKNKTKLSPYYRKGIHMIHDSFNDRGRNNPNYRLATIRNYEHVLCTSKEQYNFLDNIDVKNIFYNPLGINENFTLKERTEYDKDYKINIGFNGRKYHDNVKRVDLFTNIISNLDKTKFKVTILSPNLQDISNKLLQSGYEVITNKTKSQEEFEKLYKDIDVLLITSRFEGTPLPLVESLKMGHTVLSTRVGEVPVHLEKEYILVNSTAFVTTLNRIYNNKNILEENRLKNNSKVQHLTWKNHVDKLKEKWEKIIKN